MTGLLILAVAAALLIGGAELFVENAAAAARRLGLTTLAVGLLLAGAEPEELVTAVVAARAGHPDLAAGDAIGANVAILTLALGAAAVARPLPISRRVRSYAALAAVAGLLAFLAVADGGVSRLVGVALLAAYAGLVALIWWREREPPAIGELAEVAGNATSAGSRSSTVGLVLALAGVGLMLVGGNVAVAGATRLVAAFDQQDGPVGLTLLALATSAEFLALVGAAIRRGASELAVAGVVGSVAYNATATLGAAALASPLTLTGMGGPAALATVLPLAVLALSTGGRLGRQAGALLLAGYAAFAVVVLA